MKDAKRLLERELDTMYYNKSSLIVGHKYVRSIVMKFLKGGYKMSYLTSTTSTTTTSTTTSTTTTVPQRGRRQVCFIKEKILKENCFCQVPDHFRDYFYDNTGEKSFRPFTQRDFMENLLMEV